MTDEVVFTKLLEKVKTGRQWAWWAATVSVGFLALGTGFVYALTPEKPLSGLIVVWGQFAMICYSLVAGWRNNCALRDFKSLLESSTLIKATNSSPKLPALKIYKEKPMLPKKLSGFIGGLGLVCLALSVAPSRFSHLLRIAGFGNLTIVLIFTMGVQLIYKFKFATIELTQSGIVRSAKGERTMVPFGQIAAFGCENAQNRIVILGQDREILLWIMLINDEDKLLSWLRANFPELTDPGAPPSLAA